MCFRKKESQHYEDRLSQSVARSRSVLLQNALCNDWDWFFTGTIDKSKSDRFNVDNFICRFSQFVRDLRKQDGCEYKYMLVPEPHKKGGWHVHGFVSGLCPEKVYPFTEDMKVPFKLVKGGYYNWQSYQEKFGFCSLGRIRDPIACAFYATKYITKDVANSIRGHGSHLYFASKGLQKAEHVGDCYAWHSALDSRLSAEHEFCSTGFCSLPWYDLLEWFDDIRDVPAQQTPKVEKRYDFDTVCEEWYQMQIGVDQYEV